MLAIAGAMALLLGICGVYGVIAYAVSQRRREIGIRMALGAQRRQIRALFVRRGLAVAAVGVPSASVGRGGVARLMQSLLFGVDAARSDHVRYHAPYSRWPRRRNLSAGAARDTGGPVGDHARGVIAGRIQRRSLPDRCIGLP